MFAPDVYSTFSGMSEGSSDGSMYRGEFHNESSFPYTMCGSDEYRGKKYKVVQVTNHDLIKRFFRDMQKKGVEELQFMEFIEKQASYHKITIDEYLSDIFPKLLFLEGYDNKAKSEIISYIKETIENNNNNRSK